ncbi:hypothetical protein FSP39_024476 [Pinctada imbricata]|uniref:AAA+ ATPase domain-containing protein n=1 Tax=Pinctada imbricata TaxID=66713 RepID=A0AA89BV38_PINIB|nr:hypothetical protein FSP39_024476 [Pinctada imbricata]
MQRIGVSGIKLTEHELCFAADLVDPESIAISWRDIGGLDETIRTIREKVIFPFKRRDLLVGSALIRPPKGVLLYGPPGCGKTTIAKAMAKDAGARFINFQMSSLLDKWHGESEKRADALFSLARKIQPAIIFIDEIDSFLRVRNLSDHANMATLKGQFMSLWDGLITDATCQIMVVGATNRPQDVDAAILRRMSSKFSIGKPAQVERKNILGIILRTEDLDETVDLDTLAGMTEEFSGSELLEACRLGATHRIHEIMRNANKSHLDDIYDVQIDSLRKMSMADLILGVSEVRQAKYGISGQEFSNLVLD